MKPLLVTAFFGLALLVALFREDPRVGSPAAIPARYLVQAGGECRAAIAEIGPDKAAGVCGCIIDWVGDNLTFKALRALRVELAAATAAGVDSEAYARVTAKHQYLLPVIARCRAEQGL